MATNRGRTETTGSSISATVHSQRNNNTSKNTNTREENDDESVLDIAEQTLRPLDVAIAQQRVEAWHPILDPVWVIVAFFYLGAILLPVAFKINSIQNNVIEMSTSYDDYDNYTFAPTSSPANLIITGDNNTCGIGTVYNANKTCTLTFLTPENEYMYPPIFIYYELRNFHQNHRNYYQSKDAYQLKGKVGDQDKVSATDCDPLNILGNITLNPCGLIANTLFNDYFTLIGGKDINGNDLVMNESGITWLSDYKYLYSQPNGFNYSVCEVCDETCCLPGDSCTTPYYNKSDGLCYRYYYPNDDTTQYLYETYPMIISPIQGVLNEHFMVWMRISVSPTFRKLYGYIDQVIPPNTTLTFQVNANYVVTTFQGGKSVVISTTSIFGGRTDYFYKIFFISGLFCLVAGTFFLGQHVLFPRKIADDNYLHYKED